MQTRMNIFITGATGYIGNKLAKKLADEGNTIHALCRNVNTEVLHHPNIKIFNGDITDIPFHTKRNGGLRTGVSSCCLCKRLVKRSINLLQIEC